MVSDNSMPFKGEDPINFSFVRHVLLGHMYRPDVLNTAGQSDQQRSYRSFGCLNREIMLFIELVLLINAAAACWEFFRIPVHGLIETHIWEIKYIV